MIHLHTKYKQNNRLKASQVCKRIEQQINKKQQILEIQDPLVSAHQHSDSINMDIVKLSIYINDKSDINVNTHQLICTSVQSYCK